MSLETGFSVSSAIWLYTLRYKSITFDMILLAVIFRHVVFTQTVCASFAAACKCNNLRDRGHPYELPDLWPPNSPDLDLVD